MGFPHASIEMKWIVVVFEMLKKAYERLSYGGGTSCKLKRASANMRYLSVWLYDLNYLNHITAYFLTCSNFYNLIDNYHLYVDFICKFVYEVISLDIRVSSNFWDCDFVSKPSFRSGQWMSWWVNWGGYAKKIGVLYGCLLGRWYLSYR